jgi:DNA-3-methyladenine glycosylase I
MPRPRAVKRCAWSLGVSDAYQAYHDGEWGVPVRDDRKQFEFLILEGAQAGLSWSTVLHKRDGYREAFADFDPEKVARFNKSKIELLLKNPNIIRNRLKVVSAVTNFSDYIWGFVDGKPIQNRWKGDGDVPASTPISDALSKDLKKRGFRFVGTTIVYAHMQATGLVNDHITSCYRHAECKKMA